MRKLLIPVLLFYSLTFAREAQISIPLNAINGINIQHLFVGLDTCATNGIDTCAGEGDIYPPPPPAGAFDARLILPAPYSAAVNKDYRHADFPFTGTTEHKIIWQMATGISTFAIQYELPLNCSMNIKDPFGGGIFNSGILTGTGIYDIPAPTFNQAIITMTYNNITPPAPVFTISPNPVSFQITQINNTVYKYSHVRNTGNSPLIISGITSSDSQFACTPWTLPDTIAPNVSVYFHVFLTPSGLGTKSGTLTFTHNAGTSNLPMMGTCVPHGFPSVPKVLDFITISDQAGSSRVLHFGLDPAATDTIDGQFGEWLIPPGMPPAPGMLWAWFILPQENYSGIVNSERDFRKMPVSPFSGIKEFRFWWQMLETGGTGAKISWNFPPYLSCLLQDFFGTVNVTASGTGSVIVNSELYVLKMIATYTGALPVELNTFTANVNGDKVFLNWQTASEKNNKGFDVERKTYNSDWEKVAFIQGTGTSTIVNSYSYNDNPLPPGSYTYQLKQVDYDGTFTYSKEVTAEVAQVTDYILSQNYPNPFNPTTVISYILPKPGLVTLKVYNAFGEEAIVLVNEIKAPGKHKVQFNAQELASGVYLYKITSENFTETKKMLLVK